MPAKRTTRRPSASTRTTKAAEVEAAEVEAAEVEAAEVEAAEVEAAPGELVELHDGAYALVLTADPVTVLRLGAPERHEVPFARKVG